MCVKGIRLWIVSLVMLCMGLYSYAQTDNQQSRDESKLLQVLHTISSHQLFKYVEHLSSEKYEGRLTGTEAYNKSARWVASLLNEYNVEPAGDEGTYFQHFNNPFTLVLDEGEVILHIPLKKGLLKKSYTYEEDYYPGSTSTSAYSAETM